MPAACAWPACQARGAVIKALCLAPVQQIQVVSRWAFFTSLLPAKVERALATNAAGLAPLCAVGRPSWLPKNSRGQLCQGHVAHHS